MGNSNKGNSSPLLQNILSKLKKVKYIGSGRYKGECPAHADSEPSLSITTGDDGRILLKCFAGCEKEAIVKAVGMEMKDLFPSNTKGRQKKASPLSSPKKRATVQPLGQVLENIKGETVAVPEGLHATGSQPSPSPREREGCTLAEYSELKQIPIHFLQSLGVRDSKYGGKSVVRIPYYDNAGKEVSVQYRIGLQGDKKFRWRGGDKAIIYGLNRDFKSKGYVILCEGPSDTQTLWYNDFPALGIASASTWSEERDAILLDGVASIFVVIEPDQGGIAVQKRISISSIRDRVKLLTLDGFKDPSSLYLDNKDHFKTNMKEAMSKAVLWKDLEVKQQEAEREKLWTICKTLAEAPDILSRFADAIESIGVAGQKKEVQTLYLMISSRHQKRPVSAVLKGQSATGKSFLIEQTLRFFPPSSYKELTAMSEHTLAYGEESLSNKYLILFEVTGISNEIANYLLRSLLSEGRVLYETVEKGMDGKLKVRRIERPGPTGTIITTTQIQIHPENETRLLSMNISDSKEQTRDILLALSGEERECDLSGWQALQSWIDLSEHRVTIPYARDLADQIPPVAVRLRRDYTQVLNLIRSHAMLHQATRRRDSQGRIIAEIKDYAAVRSLVSNLLSEGIGATVSPRIREVVAAVNSIIIGTDLQQGKPSATLHLIATLLKKDKSTVSRQVMAARKRDYLVNNEKVKGKPAQIVLGDPLPDDVVILPDPEMLDHCTVAVISGGERESVSPSEYDDSGLPDDPDLSFPPDQEIDLQGKVTGVIV